MSQLIKTPLSVGIFEAPSYGIAKEKFGDSRLMEQIESEFGMFLAKNPYYGEAIHLTKELFAFKTQAFLPRVPSFRILYRYSPEVDPFNVELLDIEPANNTPCDISD